jgi:hypothetical protein
MLFRTIGFCGALLGLAACGSVEDQLIYLQTHKVGLSISASAPQQGGSLSLGYEDANLVIMPFVRTNNEGESRVATVTRNCEMLARTQHADGTVEEDARCDEDIPSVFGSFDIESGAEGGLPTASLGKFFATGFAAEKLADAVLEERKKQTPPPSN